MATDDPDGEDDPRIARIVRRMRLFVGVSTGVMVLGFLLVMSVIVYRTVKGAGTAAQVPSAPVVRQIPLAGGRIVATAADAGRLYVTVEAADGTRAVHVFLADGLVYLGRIEATRP